MKFFGLPLALFTALFLQPLLRAADWHVDAKNGADHHPGTAQSPLKTLRAAMDKASGGDRILLQPGDYAAIDHLTQKPWGDLYDDFVIIQPAPGVENSREKISIAKVAFGMRAGLLTDENQVGKFNAWVKIRGVRIPDGVYVFGYNHLHIEDCRIERIGPHVGSVENIEKTAVVFGAGEDLVLRDSQVTATAAGVVLSAQKGKVINNEIHDITHDGIRAVSSKNCLIEGNRIYNLDDGVDDGDPRGEGWNRHCDAIHIFIPGPGLPAARNENLIIRGNVMYNCESQAIQFNNYLRVKDVWNENVLIENNIFGPTRANAVNIADPVDGIIFRNNTFIHFPEGRSFQGRGRVIHCDNHTFRINPVCKNAQVYNNILVNAPTPSDGWFVGYNLIIGNKGVPTRFDRFHVDPKFKDPEAFDGKLADDSPAIDAGTARFAPSPLHPVDFHGAPRDLRPDCGAVEMPGRSPDPEAATPVKTESVITWLDDFKDGDRAVDPWLAGKQQAGLSWTAPEGQSAWSINPSDGKNKLSAISINGLTRMRAEQGGDWTDFSVRALTLNAYNTLGAGVVLRAGPGMEGYWVDLVHARIVRMDKDADGNLRETELAAADNLLPRLEAREVLIRIIDTPQGPEIQVDAHADGTVEMKAVDTAANPIRKGGLELFNHSSNGSHRTDWLRVEVKTTP